MAGLMEAMRAAINGSGKSRYRIAKETGVAASQLSRLMRGETELSVDSIERIADYLGLQIVIRSKRGRKGKRA